MRFLTLIELILNNKNRKSSLNHVFLRIYKTYFQTIFFILLILYKNEVFKILYKIFFLKSANIFLYIIKKLKKIKYLSHNKEYGSIIPINKSFYYRILLTILSLKKTSTYMCVCM